MFEHRHPRRQENGTGHGQIQRCGGRGCSPPYRWKSNGPLSPSYKLEEDELGKKRLEEEGEEESPL
jgi:hypothetical protein